LIFNRLTIPDVVLVEPQKFGDERGYFMETFRQSLFEEGVASVKFVQANQSLSRDAGTVRGLHFQLAPEAQGKLVSCVTGAIFDVAVDLRTGSPTYGQHVSAELSSENGRQLWIPEGFAHGFCTLKPMTTVSYKVTAYYASHLDKGILWNDPALAISWPVDAENAILSAKDRIQPALADLKAVL
jgi:dTDP-4-dehydrorhamnose 3,5-epimerase